METRILTLFDDDFFPPEPPKEKPKKEKAPKPVAENTPESTEAADKEKDIIAQALNEFREKELKETAGNESSATPETEAIQAPETNVTDSEIIASSEMVLEEVYHDTILEETIMADAIHFEEPQEPAFVEPEMEPVIYSDEIAEDAATEEDIITSMEEENDVVDDIVNETTDEVITITSDIETAAEMEGTPEENIVVENVAVSNKKDSLNDISDEVKDDENVAKIIIEDAVTNTTKEETATDEADTAEQQSAETASQQTSSDDKELNKQILSELIQLDYTALMQKEYAFDLNKATVINKELPKQKPQQDKVVDLKPVEIIEEEEEEVFEDVTPLPEWKLDKKYYTIGEVATLFEVNTSHIRFWTNEFKLRPRTTRKGDRLYSPKDIAELRLIHHLVKVKKHTIKGAREKLKAEKTDVNNKLDLKESLVQLKNTLLKIREQL